MPIPNPVLPPELANDVDVLTRKAGLSPWHARLLKALERIADYYDSVPAAKTRIRPGASDA
jgi:hypothetical protein